MCKIGSPLDTVALDQPQAVIIVNPVIPFAGVTSRHVYI